MHDRARRMNKCCFFFKHTYKISAEREKSALAGSELTYVENKMGYVTGNRCSLNKCQLKEEEDCRAISVCRALNQTADTTKAVKMYLEEQKGRKP